MASNRLKCAAPRNKRRGVTSSRKGCVPAGNAPRQLGELTRIWGGGAQVATAVMAGVVGEKVVRSRRGR